MDIFLGILLKRPMLLKGHLTNSSNPTLSNVHVVFGCQLLWLCILSLTFFPFVVDLAELTRPGRVTLID